MSHDDGLKPVHKCERIASAPFLHAGREYWLGRLTEKVAEWPLETHCLHMRTPVKDVTFLLNRGDFEALAVFVYIFFGHPVNQTWLASMETAYKKRAAATATDISRSTPQEKS